MGEKIPYHAQYKSRHKERSRLIEMGGREGEEDQKSAAAVRWLEGVSSKVPSCVGEAEKGGFFDSVCLWRLQVIGAKAGRALCTFKIPKHLADENGNWHEGAIATVIDDVGATAIQSSSGDIKVSVAFDISYFSPAKIEEEVEIEARVLHDKGRLSAVVVDIRKKGGGELVASGRQWMSSTRSKKSKL